MRQHVVAVFLFALFASVFSAPTVFSATFNISPEKIQKPIIRTLDSVGDVGQYTSIAIGRDGLPVMSYYDYIGYLKFAKCHDSTCGTLTIRTLDSTGDVGMYSSLAIGRDGYPVISYYDLTNGDLKFLKCNDASCSSTTIRSLDTTGDVGQYTSIAIGRDGYPVISYVTYPNLKFAKCNDASCSAPTIRTLTTDGYGKTSIAIGADGYPLVSYPDGTFSFLKLRKCNDASCSSTNLQSVDSSGSIRYDAISQTIGRDGTPIIAFTENTNTVLKVRKCVNNSCTSSQSVTVDGNSWMDDAEQLAITVGRDGFPVIAYKEYPIYQSGSLKLAKCNNATCTSATIHEIDTKLGNVDIHISLVVGRDGYPVIAYYDPINKDLKFAYVGSQVKLNTPSKSNLSAWYKLDENKATFTDSSGNGGLGSITGTVGRIGGRISGAFDFSGASGNSANITGGTQPGYPFSISLWFKADALQGALVSYGAGNTTIAMTGGYLHLAGGTPDGNNLGTPLSNFTTGKWYHLVATYPNASGKKLYVNAVNKTTSTNDYWEACGFQIGRRVGCGGTELNFNGAIDDVRVYNKVLSSGEIQDIYRDAPSVVGATQASLIPSGLVGYWSFNGPDVDWRANKVIDRSGQGNDGAIINMSTSTAGKGGKVGQGFRFDGADDVIYVGSPATLDNMTEKTVSAWIKPGSFPSYQYIISKYGIPLRGWDLGIGSTNSSLTLEAFFSGADGTWRGPTIRSGEWQHIVMTYSYASAVNVPVFYINGVATTTTVISQPTGTYNSDSSDFFGIGRDPTYGGTGYSGTLDEVRIYNRILSASEIMALYNAGK